MKLPQKTLKIILVMSLSLNLLIAASAVGFFANGRHKDPRIGGGRGQAEQAHRGPGDLIGPLLRSMDRGERRALGREIQDAMRAQGISPRQQRQQRQSEFITLLSADVFDRQAVALLFAATQTDAKNRMNIAREIIVDKLEGMSPEERSKFATALQQTARR